MNYVKITRTTWYRVLDIDGAYMSMSPILPGMPAHYAMWLADGSVAHSYAAWVLVSQTCITDVINTGLRMGKYISPQSLAPSVGGKLWNSVLQGSIGTFGHQLPQNIYYAQRLK